MPFPDRLYLVLAEVHLQLTNGMDLSVAVGMPDEVFLSEIRIASLTLLRTWRVDAISEEDRIAISDALATAVHSRMKRLFGQQPEPPAGEAERVLESAYAAFQSQTL
jgi:hypothetical protein